MFGFTRSSRKPVQKISRGRDIAVGGRRLPLTIRENVRATRMTLRIEPGGKTLKMSVPTGISDQEIDRFLHRHHGWLTTRLDKLPKAAMIAEGHFVPVRDIPHRIERTGKLRGISKAEMVDEEWVLSIGGAPEHLARRVADFLKKQARADLEPAVDRHARSIGRSVAAIRFKDTKSRWGSCTSDGQLSFSWRIVMAPDFVIDYLAAHEVAHLQEMNHGPKFWALCHSLCARTDEAKSWLKHHGSALHAVDFS